MQQILDGRNQRIAQEGCVVCSQEITNPICAKCHKNHILVWLQDHPIAEDVKKEIQSNINKKLIKETDNETKCIICGKGTVSICSYCFYFNVEKIINKESLPNEILKEFEQSFHYELYETKHSFA